MHRGDQGFILARRIDPRIPLLGNAPILPFHSKVMKAFGLENPLVLVPELSSIRVRTLHLLRKAVQGDGL